MTPKIVGELHRTPVIEDPNCPPGQIYFFNDKNIVLARIDARSRRQRIVDSIKKRYNQLMKTRLLILAALVVILVCTCVAIVVSNNRKAPADPRVKSLQTQLKKSQDVQKQHDAVNTTAIKNAGDQIILLTNDKNTLCTQIKAAKLPQPLCP